MSALTYGCTALLLQFRPARKGTVPSTGLCPARSIDTTSQQSCTLQPQQPEARLGRRALLSSALAIGLAALAPVRRARADDAAPSPQQPDSAASSGSSTAGDDTRTVVPLTPEQLEQQAAAKLLEEEEERRKARKRKKGRIRELEEIRAELAEKELVLLEKEKELLEKDQTVMVLREELEIEKKLRSLLTKEKEKAEEEATLAMALCTGTSMLP